MPREWQAEKITIQSEFGDTDEVFRYLCGCKHCVSFEERSGFRGFCRKYRKNVTKTFASCPAFIATEDGFNTIWFETVAKDGGDFVRVMYKGKAYFLNKDAFVAALGFDPDERD